MGHFGIPCGAHGGPWGLPVTPVGPMWTPWVSQWAQLGATGSLCKLLVGPGGSIWEPFGSIWEDFGHFCGGLG